MGGRDLSATAPEDAGPAAARPGRGEIAGWAVLSLLLLSVLVGALTFDRTGRPGLVGDEATYAMQASSLARDFDLTYSRADYDRFVADWGGPPDGLILQKRVGGTKLTYGKPFLYALVIAPFVRFAPLRGALVANALMLAAAALLAARTLRLRVGPAAPLYVAAFVFASVAFGYAFWVHADLFQMASTAAGLALVYGVDRRGAGRPPASLYEGDGTPPERPLFWRFFAAGALLAVAIAFRPFYGALLLPAALAAPPSRRKAAWGGLAAGAGLLLLLTAVSQWGAGGTWTGYGGLRQGFYPRTGYPGVDFPASRFEAVMEKFGNTSWLQEGAIEIDWSPRLWGWDALYFLIGRNIGILPYFLPLFLGIAAFRKERGRWAIPLAVVAAVACFFALRPFNFYGGGGAIGNRYFLPLYPALWFLAGRPGRFFAPLLVTLAAAPFLAPLWRHPTAFPVGEDGRYAYVSRFAYRWLPYETTQSHIPGGQDTSQRGLWVKLLNHNVYRTTAGKLRIVGANPGEILVGSPTPLRSVGLEFDRKAPARLEIGGQTLRPDLLRPSGAVSYDIPVPRPRAVHPMWWTPDDYYLYELEFRLPGAPAEPIGVEIYPGMPAKPGS